MKHKLTEYGEEHVGAEDGAVRTFRTQLFQWLTERTDEEPRRKYTKKRKEKMRKVSARWAALGGRSAFNSSKSWPKIKEIEAEKKKGKPERSEPKSQGRQKENQPVDTSNKTDRVSRIKKAKRMLDEAGQREACEFALKDTSTERQKQIRRRANKPEHAKWVGRVSQWRIQ